ncbi:unnamed protein product, partial [marine sediment metagenome]
DVKSPRFFIWKAIQYIGVMVSGVKPVISPTYYYPSVSTDYWDIVFISQV